MLRFTAIVAVIFLTTHDAAEAQSAVRDSAPKPAPTQVVMLGTGTPVPDPERSGPAVAIVVNNAAYLVDCGTGVVRNASTASRQKAILALAPGNLRRVFITHLHSDHTLGCPELMLSPWVLGRTAALEMYGPAGTSSMVTHISEAYRADIENRLSSNAMLKNDGYKAVVHEITPGLVYEDANVKVYAFAVPHETWAHAFGYRFVTRDRTIVISGDTRPSPAIAAQCKGCDVLVHEVYSTEGMQRLPPARQQYMKAAHTSDAELATIASDAKPGLLVFYHQLLFGATEESLMADVRKGYAGRVASAHDLEIY